MGSLLIAYLFVLGDKSGMNLMKKPAKINILAGLIFLKVHPSGEMSNFLLEDFEAVLKFVDAESQKKLKL
ncbi:MAG: hypothetical protein WAO52_15980 [Prolixibacteraceae bacterium]